MGELVTHLAELVTCRLTETFFHWENEAVSSNSHAQSAVELNGKLNETTKRSRHKINKTKKLKLKINDKEKRI
jgi:hypothetical protein